MKFLILAALRICAEAEQPKAEKPHPNHVTPREMKHDCRGIPWRLQAAI